MTRIFACHHYKWGWSVRPLASPMFLSEHGCDVQSGLSKAHHMASILVRDARHLKSDSGQNREKLCG